MLASEQTPVAEQYGTLDRQGSLIATYLLDMEKSGYKLQTILSHSRILRLLARHCDLTDPERSGPTSPPPTPVWDEKRT